MKDRVLDPAELTAVHRIAAGGSAIDPTVIEHLFERRRSDSVLAALTERERDVLAAMAEGRSNRSIASTLHTKLGLQADTNEHRRVRAVLTYLQAGGDASG